jgi:quinol monooxygenase YgiN
MIIVQGWVRVAPGEIDRLRSAALAMAEATRQEPGCLEYSFAIDLTDANLIRIAERWSDDAALAAHFASPHMASFNQALGGARIEAASVKAYTGELQRTLTGT